ncbi:DUF3299 domain-containing protein [Ruegeria lacuscaerulensis]|uniref:DUF3299 domain-containing protein n=1 Tax=Ruegeria lacuscaerulensis TaxID=55218 RepID=UPI001F1906FE|nr:DUF3299 domain-containing protein [Ruegeria lacuscaerulensis]
MAALLMMTFVADAMPDETLDWAEMPDPAAQAFEDPFRTLGPEEFDDLVFAVRLRGRLQQEIGTPDERLKWQELLAETENALAAKGVDIDWLLDQREAVTARRERAATAGNPKLDGRSFTVSGYAIPAPPDSDGQPVAYLVPQLGMCSHFPPPPPNQMIRLKLDSDWVPRYMHQPIRVTGTLAIAPSDQMVMVVDGFVPMRATFQMNAEKVEALEDAQDAQNRIETLTDRMRAVRHRKSGGSDQLD